MGSNPWTSCLSPPIPEQDKQISYLHRAIVIQIGRAIVAIITRPPIVEQSEEIGRAHVVVAVEVELAPATRIVSP